MQVERHVGPSKGSFSDSQDELDPVLSIRDLIVDFPGQESIVRAVDGISLDVSPGRRVGIVGESGSGKSTLALAILGLLEAPGRVVSGAIRSGGCDILSASDADLRALRGGRISMVFQDSLGSLNPVMTVGKQIREAISLHNDCSAHEATSRAISLLTEVGVPTPEARLGQYPHELSGGMQQRVMIAMALASNPALLIADEPTTALDVTTQAAVLELLHVLSEERGMAVLLITHDLGVVAGFAEDVLVMYAGAPVEYGPVDEIFGRPGHPYTEALIAAVPSVTEARGTELRSIPGGLPPPGILQGCRFEPRCQVGRGRERCLTVRPAFSIDERDGRVACHYEDEARARERQRTNPPMNQGVRGMSASGVLVECDSLVKIFRRSRVRASKKNALRAVDDVSFQIHQGESLGLVGESGSGKSTVARLLLGLTELDAGTISFEAKPLDVRRRQLRGSQRGRIQMVFQDPLDSLDPMMTVAQLVAEPLFLLEHKRAKALAPRVDELLRLVGLGAEYHRRRPAQLSGGQRQRVAIARSLATNPALVVCDEAVSSLDVSVRAQILNLLKDLQDRLRLSYLFITHDLSVVRHVCDRVAVMYAGHIVEVADADRIFRAPQHPYTVALLSAVPIPDPTEERNRRRIFLEGDLPDLTSELDGCVFRSRCWKAQGICATESPPLNEKNAGHSSACHFPENLAS